MKRASLAALILVSAAFLISTRNITWLSSLGCAVGLGDGAIWLSRGNDFARSEAGLYTFPYVYHDETIWSVLNPDDTRQTVYSDDTNSGCVRIPLWPLAIVIVPLFAAAWWRSILPIPPGHCRACWYDLQGTPRSPEGFVTCPECGKLHDVCLQPQSGESHLPGA